MNEYTIGIDLGTTNSCVAICRNNIVEIIENERGFRVTPSVVTFTEVGHLVGDEAVDEAHKYPKTTVHGTTALTIASEPLSISVYDPPNAELLDSLKACNFSKRGFPCNHDLKRKIKFLEAKRLIGQKFDDPKVQDDIRNFTYNIFNDLGTPKIRIACKNEEPREYYPEEISAYILIHMKSIAEKRLQTEVTRAVVTVPAYFNDAQRQATKDAAKIAGFKLVNVINEPTAAALAFHHKFSKPYKRNIIVYDFGGGTFDVTVVAVGRGSCDVKATKGDSHLGGTDIDTNLVKYIRQDFEVVIGKELDSKNWTQRRLKNICETNKKRLSGSTLNTEIELNHLLVGDDDYRDYTKALSRARFEQLNQKYFDRTLQIVDECLKDSGIKKNDIDEVVLVGGSSRIPKIQKMLKEYFGEGKINNGMNPDEAVAYGAAIHATNIAGNKDEVHDVTSLSLGTNTFGDSMSVIIPRNTPVPAISVKRYQTIMDNQLSMEFPIYQGENDIASENFELGNFTMTDLTEAPAKSVKVEVCFQIDAEGLLHISAKEINAENKKDIVIDVKKNGLTEEQIQERKLEFEQNKEKGKTIQKFKEARYELEVLLNDVKAYSEECTTTIREDILEVHDQICKWLEKAQISHLDEFPDKRKVLTDLLKGGKVEN